MMEFDREANWLEGLNGESTQKSDLAELMLTFLDSPAVGHMLMRGSDFLWANRRFAQLCGAAAPSDLTGRSALSILLPESLTLARELFAGFASGELKRAHNYVSIRRLNDRAERIFAIWLRRVEYRGEWLVVGSVVDESEPLENLRLLSINEELQRSIHQAIQEGVLLLLPGVKAEQFRVEVSNPAAADLLGIDRSKLRGSDPLELLEWRFAGGLLDHLRHVVRHRRRQSFSAHYLHPERERWLRCNLIPFREGVLFTFGDISARVEAELQLQELNHSLEQQVEQRTRELRIALERAEEAREGRDRFLRLVSHELRTPLQVIWGLLEISQRLDLSSELTGYLDSIRSEVQRLRAKTTQIYDVVRLRSGELVLSGSPFSLRRTVADQVALYHHMAEEKGVDLVYSDRSQEGFLVAGDRERLTLMVGHLLENAIKFSLPDGQVRLRLYARSQESSVHFSLLLRDYGIGIAEEFQRRLNQPFAVFDSSNQRETAGIGLGLTMVPALAELMGGRLQLFSEEGKGTLVKLSLTLPRLTEFEQYERESIEAREEHYREHDHSDLARSKRGSDLPGQGDDATSGDDSGSLAVKPLQVLVAEDNEMSRMVLKHYLAIIGVEASFAINGDEAVAVASQGGVDAILMDIYMPRKDGIEATREIRALELSPRPVIIGFTANSLDEESDRAIEAGMDTMLLKPTEIEQLRQLFQELFPGRLSNISPAPKG